MPFVFINVSVQGGKTAGGKKATIVTRGSTAAGAVTVAFDPTLVTTKADLASLIQEAVVTAGDQLK